MIRFLTWRRRRRNRDHADYVDVTDVSRKHAIAEAARQQAADRESRVLRVSGRKYPTVSARKSS
jgi:hypothetical protein